MSPEQRSPSVTPESGRVLTPEGLVPLVLVPVEVFGAEYGYGLSDAVSAWSDCNRARGHIYRVEDMPEPLKYRSPGEVVQVWVRPEDLPFFEKKWGDDDA